MKSATVLCTLKFTQLNKVSMPCALVYNNKRMHSAQIEYKMCILKCLNLKAFFFHQERQRGWMSSTNTQQDPVMMISCFDRSRVHLDPPLEKKLDVSANYLCMQQCTVYVLRLQYIVRSKFSQFLDKMFIEIKGSLDPNNNN